MTGAMLKLFTMQPGKKYLFSYDSKDMDNLSPAMQVLLFRRDVLEEGIELLPAADYTVTAVSGRYEVELTAPSEEVYIVILQEHEGDNDPYHYYVDNITLQEGWIINNVCDDPNAPGIAKSRYRFGFNGMEEDNEVEGYGNSLDFGARIYDCKLGRWLSTDPLQAKYPGLSSYNFVANSPILYVDPDGKRIRVSNNESQEYVKECLSLLGLSEAFKFNKKGLLIVNKDWVKNKVNIESMTTNKMELFNAISEMSKNHHEVTINVVNSEEWEIIRSSTVISDKPSFSFPVSTFSPSGGSGSEWMHFYDKKKIETIITGQNSQFVDNQLGGDVVINTNSEVMYESAEQGEEISSKPAATLIHLLLDVGLRRQRGVLRGIEKDTAKYENMAREILELSKRSGRDYGKENDRKIITREKKEKVTYENSNSSRVFFRIF